MAVRRFSAGLLRKYLSQSPRLSHFPISLSDDIRWSVCTRRRFEYLQHSTPPSRQTSSFASPRDGRYKHPTSATCPTKASGFLHLGGRVPVLFQRRSRISSSSQESDHSFLHCTSTPRSRFPIPGPKAGRPWSSRPLGRSHHRFYSSRSKSVEPSWFLRRCVRGGCVPKYGSTAGRCGETQPRASEGGSRKFLITDRQNIQDHHFGKS